MKNIYNICKTCLGILFALISIYVIKECVFGHYIEGVLMAKTLAPINYPDSHSNLIFCYRK